MVCLESWCRPAGAFLVSGFPIMFSLFCRHGFSDSGAMWCPFPEFRSHLLPCFSAWGKSTVRKFDRFYVSLIEPFPRCSFCQEMYFMFTLAALVAALAQVFLRFYKRACGEDFWARHAPRFVGRSIRSANTFFFMRSAFFRRIILSRVHCLFGAPPSLLLDYGGTPNQGLLPKTPLSFFLLFGGDVRRQPPFVLCNPRGPHVPCVFPLIGFHVALLVTSSCRLDSFTLRLFPEKSSH